jgi:dihydrolipoamide dehydrogenase
MAQSAEKDVVVVGGGPGGYVAAIRAAQNGLNVACVEKRGSLGGTCLNVGCIPSKALLNSTHKYEEATKSFATHGIVADNVRLDLNAMMKQKNDAVKSLTKGIEGLFKKNKVEYVRGHGTANQGSVHVAQDDGSERTIGANSIVLATGSEPASLPNVPIDEERIVTSTGALELKEVPKHLVVIGGGVIGLEMGSVWGRLGAKVSVIEYTGGIVPGMDNDARKAFERSLKKQGMNLKYNTKVTGATRTNDVVRLTTESAKGDGTQEEIDADYVLVATGRKPYTDKLGLQELGVEMDGKGRVPVDHNFRTNVDGVYAIGDVVQGPMLAHKAEDDGVALADQLAGKHHFVDYNQVPNIIYTHPEVAGVGMTEEEAKEAGINYTAGSFPFMANSRARAVADADGMFKLITEKSSDKVIGAHVVSPQAGELIQECTFALHKGATSKDIAETCHGHPTMSESIKEAALSAHANAIHY